MVNPHLIALFSMMNSHPIALFNGELSPHYSFSVVNCHPTVLFHGKLSPYTPYSKMAAASDDLGRVARERGIEGHDSIFTCLHVVA